MVDTGIAAGYRTRVFVLCAFVLVVFVTPLLIARDAAAQIGSSRYAAFMQDADTGEVLFAVNADEPRYPASLTKMMTLYLAFEALKRGTLSPDTRIRVSRHAASMEPSKLGLRAGSTIRARDAIMALVTKSANDAAAALAEHLSGSTEAAFARMMTRKARALGMARTTFRNASGLPDPAQVTTARDMAVLSRRLIRDFPNRYAYFSTTSFDWKGRHIPNHNRLLAAFDGTDGIKTGYIRASGFNMAASAVRDGRRLIAVVFGGASGAERDEHVMALLDRGFDEMERDAPTGTVMAGSRSSLGLVASANAASLPSTSSRTSVRLAAAAVSRAQRVPDPPASTASGSWAVQVGAFSGRGPAQTAAKRAAKRNGGKARVERVRVRGKWFWRARVAGLSAAEARGYCRAASGPCMVLSPNLQ